VIALIDADNVAIASAWSAENETEQIACARAHEMVAHLCQGAEADTCELWLSGPNNFRYNIYPEYKAHRADMRRPVHEKVVKQYLIDQLGAQRTDGIEADDMLGIRQCEIDNNSIIVHLDKDMDQIPGRHYSWELKRKGVVVREAKKYYVTEDEGNRFFFYQLLVGDSTDNIKGIPRIGKVKANSILSGNSIREWYEATRDAYGADEELDMNAQCVYIWRKLGDNWKNLVNQNTGQTQDSKPSSLEF
jgi:5'-3' exonuclease